MRNLSNGPKYLDRTIDVILQIKKDKILPDISVKNIRRVKRIDGSNRSATRLYSVALAYLAKKGVLRQINNGSPKKYELIDRQKLINGKKSQ